MSEDTVFGQRARANAKFAKTAAKPSALRSRPWWNTLIDFAVLIVVLVTAVLGFAPTYALDGHFFIAALGGIVLGLGLATVSAYWRWGTLLTIASALLVYILLGSAFAAPDQTLGGVVPTGDSLRTVIGGVVLSWKNLLTIAAPVGVGGTMLVVPFLSAFVCSLIAGLLALRLQRAHATAIPVLVLFVVAIVFGTTETFYPVVRGAIIAVVLIAWLAWRRELAAAAARSTLGSAAGAASAYKPHYAQRIFSGLIVVLIAALVSVFATPVLALGTDKNREVLRNAVIPPLDPKELPSPLTDFRRYLDTDKDTQLMTVDNLPRGGRVRLAALDSYDGIVYNVDPGSSAAFAPVGDPRALNPNGGNVSGQNVSISVAGYRGVYIPSVRDLQALSYQQANGEGSTLYLNQSSNTAVKLDGVNRDDKYNLTVDIPTEPSQDQLKDAKFASPSMPRLTNVPDIVAQKANQITEKADAGYPKLKALVDYFRLYGKYTTGVAPSVVALPGHSAARITSFLSGKELVGNDEQYAVAAALMARSLGIPARVVMGFYQDPKSPGYGSSTVSFKGSDVHAWLEVDFNKYGWVRFDPTPDKDNQPKPPDPEPASSPKPQVLQPPPPPQDRAELPPDTNPDPLDNDKKKPDFWAGFWAVVITVVVFASPLILIVLILLTILLLKRRRRKRRRNAAATPDAVAGGWSEVLSLATDLGAGVNPKATRQETAGELAQSFPKSAGSTVALAQRADAAIFAEGQPSPQQVQEYWSHVDHSLTSMRGSVSRWRRMLGAFNIRSLIMDATAALTARAQARKTSDSGSTRNVGLNPPGQKGRRTKRSKARSNRGQTRRGQ